MSDEKGLWGASIDEDGSTPFFPGGVPGLVIDPPRRDGTLLKTQYYCHQCKRDVQVEASAYVVGDASPYAVTVEVQVACKSCGGPLVGATEQVVVREGGAD